MLFSREFISRWQKVYKKKGPPKWPLRINEARMGLQTLLNFPVVFGHEALLESEGDVVSEWLGDHLDLLFLA